VFAFDIKSARVRLCDAIFKRLPIIKFPNTKTKFINMPNVSAEE
jgi:hypothetical protein